MVVQADASERILFVHDLPGDESLVTGGTIAALHAAGAVSVVLYASDGGGIADAARAALDELGVAHWAVLPGAPNAGPGVDPGSGLGLGLGSGLGADRGADAAVAAVLRETEPTSVVIAATGEAVRAAAIRAGAAHGVPVFLAGPAGTRSSAGTVSVDVTPFLESKRRAVAAFPERWDVVEHAIRMRDGTLCAITGEERFEGLDGPEAAPTDEWRPSRAGRLVAAIVAFLVGVLFGVLGTVSHQSTIPVGETPLPVGLVLSLAAAAALLVGLRMVLHDRLVVLSCAIGMLGIIFLLSLRSAGGSVLIPAGLPGVIWTTGPTLVAAIVLAWPRLPANRR